MNFPSLFIAKILARWCFIISTILVLVVPANGDEIPAERQDAIRQLVREYLLANPEVIVEALTAYEAQEEARVRDEARRNLTAMQAEIFNNPQDPVMGNAAGDVTVVEFFDYHCGYCKRVVAPLVEVMTADRQIKLVLKELPILGPASAFAAKAALAARAQAAYDKLHFALLAHRGRLSAEIVLQIAASIGLDVERLKADMKAPAIAAMIAANQRLANALNVRGTPAFIIGDELVPGAVDADGLRRLVAKARENN